jgi:flagellar biosynthesis protein FlhF
MKIKTFRARTIAEALQQAKQEFGPEALILSTKEKPVRYRFGIRSQGSVEVVAAVDADPSQDRLDIRHPEPDGRPGLAGPPCFSRPSAPGECSPPAFRIDAEYNEMRRALHAAARPVTLGASLFPDAASYELYQDLVSNDVSDWLAYKLLDEVQRTLASETPRERAAIVESACAAARRLLPQAPDMDGLPGKPVVAFVGPTGAGKTTAIAKLGARLALERKRSVLLVTTDACRIGAVEQLRTYAGLMGLPFRIVHQAAELPQMIEQNRQRDFILIDTAGRGPRDMDAVGELMRYLRGADHAERHLVISATTKSVDMHEIVDRFGICNPDHLLFTKLDETSTFGPIFNELVRTQKTLSYFTDGQRVPEDMHVARTDQLIEILLNTH